jgi:lysophospholipase L1-like esterase
MPRKDQYILDRPTGRSLRARDAILVIAIAIVLLIAVKGQSIRNQGNKMDEGIERTLVLAVGKPAGWIADRVGIDDNVNRYTASLSPDQALNGPGGFDDLPTNGAAAANAASTSGVVPVTPDAFDPVSVGDKPVVIPKLSTLLVTGDSLAQPLDVQLARRLAADGVKTVRDVNLGTGISKSGLLDWGRLSTQQVKKDTPDAIVFFLGANEGFPFTANGKTIQCCGAAWAAQYATRARKMMNTYRRSGAARVYWLTLPYPRSAARQRIARTVNAAIIAAAAPYRAQVRILDMTSLFTPRGHYRAAMPINGRSTIVRMPDGIHLNEAGSQLATNTVVGRLKQDFASLR